MRQGKRYQRMEETRAQVLRYAVALFLEQGYRETTLDQIARRIDRTKGAVLRAYPDKEAILYALVTHMFAVQFSGARALLEENADPLMVYGVETALQLHITELTQPLRELYVAAYSLPSTSSFIYRSTAGRLQTIFGAYLPEAEAKDFYEMEIASASIMRGFMSVPCDLYFTMDAKISRFLDCSLKLYNIPAQQRAAITAAVLKMDLHTMAAGMIQKTIRQAEEGFEALPELPEDDIVRRTEIFLPQKGANP